MSRSERRLSSDEVFELSDNGRMVFEYELGKIPHKNISSPFRKDSNPSFSVKLSKNGIWVYTDYGTGEYGDAIQFIERVYGINFGEAIEKICRDLNIKPSDRIFYKQEKKTPVVIEQEPTLIEFSDKPFTKLHKQYFNKYELPERFLRKKNVFAVKDLAINKRKFQMEKNWFAFAYWAEDINKCKILLLGENTPWKWRNTTPNEYLWDFPEHEVDTLFICKSKKDDLCMEYHFGVNTCSTQNESALILLDNNYERLEKIAKRKILTYGSDFQGWHESLMITEYTGWNYFNTDNYVLKYGITDPADFIAEIGPEPLKQELIKKGFL